MRLSCQIDVADEPAAVVALSRLATAIDLIATRRGPWKIKLNFDGTNWDAELLDSCDQCATTPDDGTFETLADEKTIVWHHRKQVSMDYIQRRVVKTLEDWFHRDTVRAYRLIDCRRGSLVAGFEPMHKDECRQAPQ